jgi:hypothetical protein
MQILWADGLAQDISPCRSAIHEAVVGMFKHLQHVPIPFQDWDNPGFYQDHGLDILAQRLKELGSRLDIPVDVDRCGQQDYLNQLHQAYELGYNGTSDWLSFHEYLHFCERINYDHVRKHALVIDYREKAGRLERPFDNDWLQDSVTRVTAGDVFIGWAELGKVPYDYWDDGEPNDIDRMCELAKPWLLLKPTLMIALEDYDFLDKKRRSEFEAWWADYRTVWCQHWHLSDWSLEDQFANFIIGKVDPEILLGQVHGNIRPLRVTL